MATRIVNKICLILILPINISNNEVAPVKSAFDKFAGIINAQIINTGVMTGKKPFLKSLMTSCFLLNILDKYINKASLAKSLVWMVILMIGNLIHLLPSLILAPKNKVYINKGIENRNKMVAILEKTV